MLRLTMGSLRPLTASTKVSMPHSFVPRWILKKPSSPQVVPQELATTYVIQERVMSGEIMNVITEEHEKIKETARNHYLTVPVANILLLYFQ